ncbi:hypothetical protein FHR29_002337 [Sphingobacterium sp. JUb56]|nr:hypothetical protein [Sphingobacterium sp. JUb56]
MEILITQIVEIIKEMELNSFGFSFIVLSIFIFLNLNNIVGFLKS